jgi:hypothetical protein
MVDTKTPGRRSRPGRSSLQYPLYTHRAVLSIRKRDGRMRTAFASAEARIWITSSSRRTGADMASLDNLRQQKRHGRHSEAGACQETSQRHFGARTHLALRGLFHNIRSRGATIHEQSQTGHRATPERQL